MYQTHKTYIRSDVKMSILINENPKLLLLMEHLNIDYVVYDKTVEQICLENKIELSIFLIFGNLYNGFYPQKQEIYRAQKTGTICRKKKHIKTF